MTGPKLTPWTIAVTVLSIAAIPVVVYVHLPTVRMLWESLFSPGTLGITAAESMPTVPTWVRPIGALWWASHWLLGITVAFSIEQSSYAGVPVHLAKTPDYSSLSSVPLAYVTAFAGNTFLLLAIGTCLRDERLLKRVWSYRLILDAMILIVPAILYLRSRHS